MNGIPSFAELLKEPKPDSEHQQKYVEIIGESYTRMLNIINQLIDISKIESGLIKLNIKKMNINEQFEYLYCYFNPKIETKGIQFLYKNTLPKKNALIKPDY